MFILFLPCMFKFKNIHVGALSIYVSFYNTYVAPNPPENVTATVVNSTTIQIDWIVPAITNGIIRYYTVVYRLNNSMVLMELNSTDTTALVTGLTPFTYYTFHLLAVTVARSIAGENVTARTDEAGKPRTNGK